MKIGLGQNQFFNGDGKPLSNGRISLYALGTDTLIPTYYVSGSSFVAGENPIVCTNDGRIDSVFFDAALVDVKVEEYHPDGTYAQIDTFEAGFKWESTKGVVDTIDQLREIDPAQSPVRVRGYYELGDCPERTYIWREGVSLIDDGGYNINSHISGSGAWVMLWNGETLPASLYGVMAVGISESSKITNIGKWSSLGQIVYSGDFQQVRPPIFEFDKSGFYKLGNRTIYFDGWVRTAYNCDLSDTAYYPTVHCCGIRSEFVSYAKWLFDRNYGATSPVVRDDYNEIVSTNWFGTSDKDAFMACTRCARVKYVLIEDNRLNLDSSNNFNGKIVIDKYVPSAGEPYPRYNLLGAIVLGSNFTYFPKIQSPDVYALNLIVGNSAAIPRITGQTEAEDLAVTTLRLKYLTSSGDKVFEPYENNVNKLGMRLPTYAEDRFTAKSYFGFGGNAKSVISLESTFYLQSSATEGFLNGDIIIFINETDSVKNLMQAGTTDDQTISVLKDRFAIAIKYNNHWYING